MSTDPGRLLRVFAVAVTAALLAAPVAQTIRSECDRCPPGCPMHANKLGCHQSAAAAPHARAGHATHCAPAAGITRPGCGHGPRLQTLIIVHAVLPGPVATRHGGPAAVPHVIESRVAGRGVDPPDSPPPIVFA